MIDHDSEARFEADFDRHRRELHVHCYRMLGSFEEAEDAVQETFLRAWRKREGFVGDSGYRAWLYRIATNTCLDEIRRTKRRPPSVSLFTEVPWIQPYPDRLLDQIDPDTVVVARETIELAFIAVIQLLPAWQRAVLILSDVLGWPAEEDARMLEISVASANSALQRARATLHQHRVESRQPARTTVLSGRERELLQAFIDIHERGDAEAALALVKDDIRITMPPHPWLYEGREAIAPLMQRAFGPDSPGEWRLLPTVANRLPAAASYLREPGSSEFRAFKLDVIRVEDGAIAEITTFGTVLFPEFGLPAIYPG